MSAELRGKIITSSAKAVLFHCYGDKKGRWYPNSTIKSRRETDRGTIVMQVDDWIYDKNNALRQDGDFQEQAENNQPELPVTPPPIMHAGVVVDAQARKFAEDIRNTERHEIQGNSAALLAGELLRFMPDTHLLEHFDAAVTMLHERGVDLEQHYKENTCQTNNHC